MMDVERTKYPGDDASGERIAMLATFQTFLQDTLLKNTQKFVGDRELNRHGVLHGVFRNFGQEANFYILISTLDVLTFILTFRTSGVSALPPNITAEARVLSGYYVGLRSAGRLGVMARARLACP